MYGTGVAQVPASSRSHQTLTSTPDEIPLLQGATSEISTAIDNARSLASMLRSKAEQVFGPVPEPSRGQELKSGSSTEADQLRAAISELHAVLSDAISQSHRLMRI